MFVAPLTALADEGRYIILKELRTTLTGYYAILVKEETKVKHKVPQIHVQGFSRFEGED